MSQTERTTPSTTTDAPRAFATPPVDIFESKEAFKLITELPGVNPDEVDITLEQDVLTLRAPRADQALDYRRRFTLNVPVDPEGVQAQLRDGVLELSLPKVASAQPRTISVQS